MGPELVEMGLSHASTAMTNEIIEHWGNDDCQKKIEGLVLHK
jgi:hypothetical protein